MGFRYDLAIVTGGSSGIGYSIIEGIAKLRASTPIFNISRRKPANFSGDARVRHFECDLADRTARTQTLTELLKSVEESPETGPILLVNNAGFGAYGPIASQDAEKALELIEVNVNALVEITTRLLPLLIKRGGTIVNIASTSAFQPTPFLATYGASKTFVLNWTVALNEELKKTAVNAVAICPGPTETEFFQSAGFNQGNIPAGHGHKPDYVAAALFKALERRKAFSVVGPLNKFLSTTSSLLPLVPRTWVAGKVIQKFRQN